MPALWSDRHLEVFVGDCRTVLAELAAESVHTVVTSPPYFGLRDYAIDAWTGGDPNHAHVGTVARTRYSLSAKQLSNPGSLSVSSGPCECGAIRPPQLGHEDEPDDYVAALVDVFRLVRRVLRADGTVWLNLGDTYGGSSGTSRPHGLSAAADRSDPRPTPREPNRAERGETPHAPRIMRGVRSKDLVGIPWRVAFALQADGWYLRSDVIWSKANPMPESVTDRPTNAHEYVFLLAKSPRYYFDADAVKEPAYRADTSPQSAGRGEASGAYAMPGRIRPDFDGRRNLRSVWTIATQPYAGAHFATFPEALVEPCVLAGTSAYGVCQSCGAPWRRVVERGELRPVRGEYLGPIEDGAKLDGRAGYHGAQKTMVRTDQGWSLLTRDTSTVGWRPGCDHGGVVVPATVLDPFAGSGTTGLVAQRLGRRAVLIDAKGEYLAAQAMKRNEQIPLGLVGSSTPAYGLDKRASDDRPLDTVD